MLETIDDLITLAPGAIAAALEVSTIVSFPRSPFELPAKLSRKNVSRYPNGPLEGARLAAQLAFISAPAEASS